MNTKLKFCFCYENHATNITFEEEKNQFQTFREHGFIFRLLFSIPVLICCHTGKNGICKQVFNVEGNFKGIVQPISPLSVKMLETWSCTAR